MAHKESEGKVYVQEVHVTELCIPEPCNVIVASPQQTRNDQASHGPWVKDLFL
jgi:hypothetical protein